MKDLEIGTTVNWKAGPSGRAVNGRIAAIDLAGETRFSVTWAQVDNATFTFEDGQVSSGRYVTPAFGAQVETSY